MKTPRDNRMTALLLCNGEPPSKGLTQRLVRSHDLFICADGGANAARALGLVPDVIIGDLDSLRPSTKRFFRNSVITQVARQDNTDLEKALDYLLRRGVRRVTILGLAGGRIDMVLGNFAVLWNYVGRVSMMCAGETWQAIPMAQELRLRTKRGTIISLVPFGPCSGITLSGLKYILKNGSMRVGEIGVSNVATSQDVTVRVKKGKMLVILLSPPGAPS
jgi:thiamine pyrophosphokinase